MASLRRDPHGLRVRIGRIVVDALLDLVAEVAQQALYGPGGAIAEGADGVALDLGRDFHQHVDLALVRAAFRHAGEHAPHPAHALPAGRALAAALVLVEVRDAGHGADDVGRLVHDDHRRGAERGFVLAAAVEIHEQVLAFMRRDERHRRAAGNDGEQVVAAAEHAAGMLVQELVQRDAHRFLDRARLVHVAGNAEQLRAGVVGPPDAGEPGRAPAQDIGHHRDRLDVVDRGRAAVEADIGGERRFQAGLTLLAFEAFEQRRLLAADIGAGAVMHDDIEGKTVDVVLADEAGLVGLVHRRLQALALADEFAADVDVAGVGIHGEAGEQAALDQEVRTVPHDLAVLAGAGLGFIGVDHEVVRPAVGLLGHERPFQAGREPGPAAPAQARGLDLVDDPVAPLLHDGLAAVPGAAGARAGKAPVVQAIEIGEDAVLVREHHDCPLADESAIGGFGTAASCTFAAAPGFLASASLSTGSFTRPPLPRL